MTCTVDSKGYVVIPQEIRDRLGIKPGDDVVIAECAGHIEVRKAVGKKSETKKADSGG